MKKLYLFFAVLNLFALTNYSQNFQWGKAEGLWAYDYGYGIVTDNSGNVYVAGKYEENNANFSGVQIPCAGNHDAFIVKYLPNGTVDWIRSAGGDLGDYAESISTDGTHLYVSGEIEGYNKVISFSNSTQTLMCIGDNDAFFCKYDMSGNLIWAKREGWLKSDKALAITHDNSGNVYISGYYTDTTKFNNTLISGYGGRDIYIAKYDANGTFQWFKNAGSTGRDEVKSIKCDAAGNVYVCGMFSNGCNFSGQTMTCTAGYYDAFVAKYAGDGTLQWVKKAGGDYDDVAWGLTLDSQGKIFITGEFNAYATFGTVAFPTTGEANVFVACYDASGNVVWAKGVGGSAVDRARGIGTDGTNIFITGQFGATASFDSHNVTSVDTSDIFIAACDNSGNFMWAASVGGTVDAHEPLGYESGNAVCADASGNVYATGGLLDGGTFGPFSVNGYDRTDAFVAKLSSTPAGINEVTANGNVSVYPNPSNGVFVLTMKAGEY
ncbi:MAG: hypothetical protein K0S12_1750 [Bacteroidetes bacterium]|nr:hypothetical protein [Bacteroidota bacterium]